MFTVVLAFCLFFVTARSQQFTCNFQMRSTLMPSGYVNGVLTYDWKNAKMLEYFTTSQNSIEYQYNSANGYSSGAGNQFLFQWSPTCSCTVSALSNAQPPLFASSTYYTSTTAGTVTTCVPNAVALASNITGLTLDSTTGFPLTASFSNGQSFTYSGCTQGVGSTAFTTPSVCNCGAPLDIVLVLDRSSSISLANGQIEKQFVNNLVAGFTYSPTQVNLGITNFHTNTWDGPVTLQQGNAQSTVISGAAAVQCYPDPQCHPSTTGTPSWAGGSCCGMGTCISAGLVNGADMLAASIPLEKGSVRQTAGKVIVLFTDGYHDLVLAMNNGVLTRDSAGKPYGIPLSINGAACTEYVQNNPPECVNALNADLQWAVDYADKNVPGVKIFVVGVGTIIQGNQLALIAQNNSAQVLSTSQWSLLTSLVSQLLIETCNAVPAAGCQSGCCGFCGCGSCIAPDGCDASNICLSTTITGPCCKSTVIPPPGPSQCQGTDKCYTYNCDQTANGGKGGCTKTLNPIQPNTTCAGYTCDPATGNQIYTNLCPCAVACKVDADCPGKTACNTVQCVIPNATDDCQNHCVITDTSSSCNKGNLCYTDSCDPVTGCSHVANPVTPNTQCTTYKCDPTTGKVSSTDTSARCQLGNKCYTDACDPVNGCSHVANPVTPNTQCTTYACDPTTGAITPTDTSARCQLGNKCYTDSCDPVKGCLHVANPVTPNTQCTTYACNPSTGAIVPTDTSGRCQLGDKCYTDTCDPVNGCSHVANPVTPSTKCTTYVCNSTTGAIQATDISTLCNKGDLCYTDSCDPVAGCSHVANPVPANTMCTTYMCNPATGAITTTDIGALCQKGDKCYTDTCNPVTGCSHVANPIPNNTKCTTYACNSATGTVSSTDISGMCQLGDKCYTDACDPVAGCSHVANPVPANTMCANFACQSPAGTIQTTFLMACILCSATNQGPCNDNNLCTTDSCMVNPTDPTKNLCVNTPLPANACSSNQTDLCYTYTCDPVKGCTSTKNPVPTSDMCDQYACNPATGNVSHTVSDCVSNNTDMCKHFTCDRVKGCVFTTTTVPSSDKCVQYACNSSTGNVDRTVTDCVSNNTNMCKTPSCDPTLGCVYTDVPVPASDACQQYVCNTTTGKVESTVAACGANDTNKCNSYTCNTTTGCVKSSVAVPASDACQQFTCDPNTGSVVKNSTVCNTTDKCKTVTCDVKMGCIYTPVPVPTSTACAIYSCNSTTGAVSLVVPDCVGNLTSKCIKGSCDPKLGCVYTNVTVPASDACNLYTCNATTGLIDHTTVDCSKGNTNKCIQFTCNKTTGCSSKNTTVPPSDQCNKYACNATTGAIDYTNMHCSPPACQVNTDCNDNNACTDDVCYWPDKTNNKTAVCQNTKKPASFCDDKNSCTIDICIPSTKPPASPCNHTALPSDFCDDNNACTIDTCNATSTNLTHPCSYKPINCTRMDICHNATCDPIRGCLQVPLVCPQSNNCTLAGCNVTKNTGCYIRTAGNCTPPPVGIAAGLAGGVVAGIVCAALAAATLFGGGAGYAFVAGGGAGVTATVANNPIYKPCGNSGYNPLHAV